MRQKRGEHGTRRRRGGERQRRQRDARREPLRECERACVRRASETDSEDIAHRIAMCPEQFCHAIVSDVRYREVIYDQLSV